MSRHAPPAPVLIEETNAINDATGAGPLISTSLLLAAWRGQEARALELVEASIEDATPLGQATAVSLAGYAKAVLYNGLGRYGSAFDAAQQTCELDDRLATWALPELIEAAVRSRRRGDAEAALLRLEERTRALDAYWARGIERRSRALLSGPEDAEALYREALERLTSSRIVLHLARTQLLYGEWLRRHRRRVDAREQLRAACAMFSRIGAAGFAERARRELVATAPTARERTVETRDDLTAQEAQIARLAGAGYTNSEIGAELYLSPRTVEWHLHKVFPKLGISSRKQLRGGPLDAASVGAPL